MSRLPSLLASLLIVFNAHVVHADDEAELRTFLESYVQAFNQHDADAISLMWGEQARFLDRDSGEQVDGRDALHKDFSKTFEERPDLQLTGTVDSVRFLTPSIANVEGRTTTIFGEGIASESTFSAILKKEEESWLFDTVSEWSTPIALGAADRLGELEFLIGTWVDSAAETPIVSTFRWSPNGSFLIRSFHLQDGEDFARQGTQIIGWDPRSLEIRSWSFHADGSFGDGVWSRNGETWMIKSTQTLSDGNAASGTYLMTLQNDGTLRVELVGHEIAGEPIPASGSSTLSRLADDSELSTTNEVEAGGDNQ